MPEGVAEKLDQFAASQAALPRSKPSSKSSSRAASRAGAGAPRVSPSTAVPPLPPPPANTPTQAGGRPSQRSGVSEIKLAIVASRRAFIGIGVLSLLINLLMLTGPLFMLQVYDRVMTSGSMSTLIALAMLTALLYGMTGIFELIRTRIVARAGVEIDQRLSDRIFRASLRRSLYTQGASISALRDLDSVRQFASGPAPMIFFDAPWTPIYLLVIFMVHWVIGLAATVGAAIIIVITLLSERTTRQPLAEANSSAVKSLEMADSAQRNVEALAAMGMVEAYREALAKGLQRGAGVADPRGRQDRYDGVGIESGAAVAAIADAGGRRGTGHQAAISARARSSPARSSSAARWRRSSRLSASGRRSSRRASCSASSHNC